jgi:signal transduction histidine kinase
MTLTTRLSVFVLAMLGVVLVGFSLAVYWISGRYLHRQVDERLDAMLSTLSGAVEDTPRGLEWEPDQRLRNVDGEPFGVSVVWFVADAQGGLLDRSRQSQTSEFMQLRAAHAADESLSRDLLAAASGEWQLRQTLIRATHQPPASTATENPHKTKGKRYSEVVINVGTSLAPLQATMTRLAMTLAGLSAAILLAALVAVRQVCRRVLSPVRHMALAASGIGAEDLARRLPTIETNDELGQLNRAFNGLLDRLQESFERQRRFTGEASHQLRTPLAGILGQIEVALRRERPIEEYQRVLATVHQRGSHLNQIVESLLFLSRANADAALASLENLCLNSWLPERIESWSDHQRAGDIVLCVNATQDCCVRAQPALLGELLDILIDNACKYSPPGSPVEIALDGDAEAVRIEIQDRGCGISTNDVPHLFTPFFRAEESRRRGIEGTGLGLSIARRLARVFQGELTVDSHPSRGSLFVLRLPAAQPSPGKVLSQLPTSGLAGYQSPPIHAIH